MEGKSFRKGGRRELDARYDAMAAEGAGSAHKRAKQFGVFAALSGYEELLAQARAARERDAGKIFLTSK